MHKAEEKTALAALFDFLQPCTCYCDITPHTLICSVVKNFTQPLSVVSSPHRVTLVARWCVKCRAACFCSGWWAGVKIVPRRTNLVFTHGWPTTTSGSHNRRGCHDTQAEWCTPSNESYLHQGVVRLREDLSQLKCFAQYNLLYISCKTCLWPFQQCGCI